MHDYEDKYDSDLEQVMYQEYWTELRDLNKDKNKDTKRKSASVARGATTSNYGFGGRGGQS